MKIDQFIGRNRFLSNFYITPIILDDDIYDSVEHAYQAAKTLEPSERESIRHASTPGEAKRLGKPKNKGGIVTLQPDWENVKQRVMYDLVKQKFSTDPLKSKLMETGDAKLIEGNYWHDNYWGMCCCASSRCITALHQNNLGLILMRVRNEL
jgi:ribA/ribD-fused uncharacterized protein